MGEVGQNGLTMCAHLLCANLCMAFPAQPCGPRIKQEKSQGDGECCICLLSWQILVFRSEKKLLDFLKTDTDTEARRAEEKLPGPDYFDEVDVGGADDDGGPDGGHAQPVVDSRIAEVDHEVIVPLQQPHREARLKQSLSINPHIFSLVLSFTTRTQTNNMGTQIWVQITSRD